MQYLFFDIECANPKNNAMCTFGYVLADESFNIIEKDDILMNPETHFDWYVIEHILHYAEEELCSHMPFPCYYDRISELFRKKDTMVFGFSITNDIKFLNGTCLRYKLDSIDFSFVDIQKIFGEYVNLKNQASIVTAGDELKIGTPKFIHRSDEDARITMEIAKAMCEDMQMSLFQLIELCPESTGENRKFIEKWKGGCNIRVDHKGIRTKRKKSFQKKEHQKALQATSVEKTENATAIV